jgi:hypothetical protein
LTAKTTPFPAAPALKSKITKSMCLAIVPALVQKFTENTIETNSDSFAYYSNTPANKGGCKDLIKSSNSPESLAEQLTRKNLIDHSAIRSIRDLASDNIALSGVTPFQQRWAALGFITRSPFDTYPFKDRGVFGTHIELHPKLIKECKLNAGTAHDPRYFKWFLSEQSSSYITNEHRTPLLALLGKGKDPMTSDQLKLLEKVSHGKNLKDKEIESVIDGMYNFMSVPFAKVPKDLRESMEASLKNDKANYKSIEYYYSYLFSKINHVAYISQNSRALFEIMQNAKLDLTGFQGKEPLQQFGVNAKKVEYKWAEFIERSVLRDEKGNLTDHSGKRSANQYVKRNFEFTNADKLFPAGIPTGSK